MLNPNVIGPIRNRRINPTRMLLNPQKVFTSADDNPIPLGFAKGVGNFLPEIPLTKCGMLFTKKEVAKNKSMSVSKLIF